MSGVSAASTPLSRRGRNSTRRPTTTPPSLPPSAAMKFVAGSSTASMSSAACTPVLRRESSTRRDLRNAALPKAHNRHCFRRIEDRRGRQHGEPNREPRFRPGSQKGSQQSPPPGNTRPRSAQIRAAQQLAERHQAARGDTSPVPSKQRVAVWMVLCGEDALTHMHAGWEPHSPASCMVCPLRLICPVMQRNLYLIGSAGCRDFPTQETWLLYCAAGNG